MGPGAAHRLHTRSAATDLLTSLASVLLEHVKHEVENASCYAILADEVKHASKKELLGASLRYILHKGDVREKAIGFIEFSEGHGRGYL